MSPAPSRTSTVLAIVIAAVSLTSLTGCSGGFGVPGPSSPGTSDEDSVTEGDSDGAGCLIGDWVATESGLEGWYSAFLPDEGVTVNSVLGEILLSFSVTDFIYTTREITVSMTIADQDALTLITGGVAGTYETSPGGIMSTSIDSSDLAGSATVSGITFTTEELGIDLTGAGAFVGYQCTGGNLILETQSAGTGTATIEFEPAG